MVTRAQKYRDVARFLRSKGWEPVRTRGSHEIWQPSGGGQSLSVVQHNGQVSPGIVRQVQQLWSDTPPGWS